MNLKPALLIIQISLMLSPIAFGQNVKDQKDFDFELEEEKVQYQDTKDSLKAGQAEAAKQHKNEVEDKKRLEKAKSENERLMKTVLPQIQELKKQVLQSEAVQKATLTELQKVDKTNADLKQQLVDKKDQLKASKELEADTKKRLIDARKEQLEMIRQNAQTQRELQKSQRTTQKMQKMLDNPNGLQLKRPKTTQTPVKASPGAPGAKPAASPKKVLGPGDL